MNSLSKCCMLVLIAGLGTAALVIAGPLTPPGTVGTISGSSGGALLSSDPNANFVY